MPVLIQNVEFFDNFGNGPLPAYKNNAGDRFNMVVTIWSSIRISSLANSLILDASLNTITSSSLSWIDEGFRVGDTVVCYIYSFGGTIINSWSTTINYVDAQVIDLGTIPFWPIPANNEFISIQVPSQCGRGDMEVLLNHVKNSVSGSEFSLIDGEVSRVNYSDTNSIAIAGVQLGTITGNQSGQYLISSSLTRLPNPATNEVAFRLSLDFSNSGVYEQSWFNTSECLKPYLKLKWSREPLETSNLYTKVLNETANTGWFNQGYNTFPINSVLVQGIQEIDYCAPSSHTIIVEGPIADVGIGASYIPLDETYYKNQLLSQKDLGLFLPSSSIGIPLLISGQNGSGAGWTITIDNVSVLGLQTTIELTFTPNGAMNSFMSNREDGDRLFYVWVKCGNVNLLAFADQLTCSAPVGAPLIIEGETAYFDHSENITELITTSDEIEFNTEDDTGYFGYFMLDKFAIIDSFTAKIEAFNTSTQNDFTLLQIAFNFTGVLISNDGRYLLNQTMVVNPNLPTTSLKREAKLYLLPIYDTPSQYAVGIYFPFIFNWQYWLTQTNANVDFYPNQNRNWQQYDETLGDWKVQMELSLLENGLSHNYTKDITIKPYDSEENIDQVIELYIDSSNLNVGIVTEGQLMRVVATHTLNFGYWNQSEIWGMITVEPRESIPRRILSTVIPYDNDLTNPLKPLTGLLMPITFPSPNVARMECYFNPDLINLENGCKFTTKIKGCLQSDAIVLYKTTALDGIQKTTTNGDNKTLAQ